MSQRCDDSGSSDERKVGRTNEQIVDPVHRRRDLLACFVHSSDCGDFWFNEYEFGVSIQFE